MKRLALACFLGIVTLSTACNNCGERTKFRDRFKQTDAKPAPAPCPCPPDTFGVSRGPTGYGQPIGYPTGTTPYTGPSVPSYPSGDPIPLGPPNELPTPGGYIPSPGVPSNPYAQPRPLDSSKSTPKSGAGGLTTGELKK